MPVILLHIPYVQQKVASIATKELSQYLKVPVRIKNVNLEWFNKLVLKDIYLEDRDGTVLFEANHVAAGFEVLPLLEGKLVFSSVRLFGFAVNLTKQNPHAPLNLQFLVDAFGSKDSVKKQRNIDLRFNSILIRRGSFSYRVLSDKSLPGKFNPNHVDIKNLSAKISVKAFNKDSINAHIKKMSFDEQSGFHLDKLSLNLVANRDSAFINDFEIRLPETSLKVQTANINYSGTDSLSQLLDNAPIRLQLAPSNVCMKDLSAFVPAFKKFTDKIEVSADVSGYINSINLTQLLLKNGHQMEFIGNMELKGITRPEETYLFGQARKMVVTTAGIENLIKNLNGTDKKIPYILQSLGTIDFKGEISGFFDNMVAFGTFSTAIGTIQTDLIFGSRPDTGIAMYLKGHVSTSGLALHDLIEGDNPMGMIKFNIGIDAQKPEGRLFSGQVDANIQELDFKGYKYENLMLSGKFKPNFFDGTINIDDPNGKLFAQGIFQHQGKNSVFNFSAQVQHVRLDSLHLSDNYESPDVSFSLNADFTGNNIDNVEGSVRIDSFAFNTAPQNFFLNQLKIMASGHNEDRKLTVSSDLINGEVKGAYSFTTIVPSFINTFRNYLPAFTHVKAQREKTQENNFSMLFTIENTEIASQTFKLPVSIVNPARLVGHYNNLYNKFQFEAFLPMFKIGKSSFEAGYLLCNNPEDKIDLRLKATTFNDKGLRNYIDLKMDARDDYLNTFVNWANNKQKLFKADLSATTHFIAQENEKGRKALRTEITINPSIAIFNDSIWNIDPSQIIWEDGKVTIDNFHVGHDAQFLKLNGGISKSPEDTLMLALNDLELSYIFDILNIPVLRFAGSATGTFNISDLYGSRILNTDLGIKNFSFNDVALGRLNLYSEWDDMQQGILMLGSIYKNDSTWTDVNGYIYPVGKQAGMSLHFDANDLNIAFLQPFMEKVVHNVRGQGYGHVHLYGPFGREKEGLTVAGDVFVKEGGLGIDYLNTYYTFSDSIHLTPTSIQMDNISIFDKYGNSAKVSGKVNHTYFKNISFNANILASDLLVYDVTETKNPQIYGTVYGSGSTSIRGNTRSIDFDINMRNGDNSTITLNFMKGSEATEYDFITFVNKKELADLDATKDKDKKETKEEVYAAEEGAVMKMNFQLDVNPEATIEMIIDPTSGDKIKGNGSGNLQIQYGTKSDLKMYGGYTIQSGTYNFSLQQVIHKVFKIREGSSISFRGDPFDASLNIDAIYSLSANLADLDESLTTESARTNVPVNCVLKLDGMLRNPNIGFDLELPSSSEELERRMKSIVDTEDMMTRQIVYLLVLSKFYTPSYMASNTSNFAAVASSTISSQLSSLLSSITDKVQIGTNIRANNTSFSDTQVELMLSSQLLNNRLLFNGNFGYKNNENIDPSFVGDFDLEYKLNKSGDIRLKAYNHYNDMYKYIKSAQTTQGVGIMFRKDFTRPSEIFRKKKKTLFLTPVLPKDTVAHDSISRPALPQK